MVFFILLVQMLGEYECFFLHAFQFSFYLLFYHSVCNLQLLTT